MKRRNTGIFGGAALAVLLAVLSGCTDAGDNDSIEQSAASKIELSAAYSTKLVEDRSVYKDDQPNSVVDFYITVSASNKTAEHPMTWTQMNSIMNKAEVTNESSMEIIMQEGDEQSPKSGMFGYGAIHANAQISLRGNSSIAARSDQKNYKVQLFEKAGLWRNQRTINLIKHSYDFSRLRNKISFDLFKNIPDFTSLRTQYVRLHVKDLTGGVSNYQDYGLYEQIEQPNKAFLRSHGLDPNGHLYKATNFEFQRSEEALKLKDDPTYDDAKFQSILEVKGNDDHTKLLNMLTDLNNLSLDIDDVVDKYFDRDNFLTWLGINILVDNNDTNSQNFFLYSPLNAEKWFFLPWDYDGAWGYDSFKGAESKTRPPWQHGISNYWGVKLENRFFKKPENVEELKAKIKDLRKYINTEEATKLIDIYKPIVSQFVSRPPDLSSLRYPYSDWVSELERMKKLPDENEKKFIEYLERPMPFFMGDPVLKDGKRDFDWDISYDLQGDDITYTFQIAKEPSFAHPILKKEQITSNSVTIEELPQGHYYYNVIVRDSKGNTAPAFDTFTDVDSNNYFGVKEFYVD
ncbi:CotH kinase family protein [Paenibacillus sp. CF384]|uniref:CotH kinase family protein n=1 Tax=Paenibacillus sp. CF384 TaxID=1884382 RepID=UPI00089424BB|nr:CotH kinase family protein [Paenibacillus sp. CF384]SDW66410.1 spore coat protein H [Paenibacillus sp. CF384]